ncbi:unnamed protein product [Arctia plantaginis]|uniref:Uncharacterized protein n=1 Tax=Arctia plantaginis TaxID=874455 RepID=A0A8S1AJ02_ARCPL|nr:unnamed protein product [Arctia plantaginis]
MKNKDEPASSGDSGDESGSEPESPREKLMHVHKQDWMQNENSDKEPIKREAYGEPIASTSSSNAQEADSSKPPQGLPKLLPKPVDLPGGAMLYHSGVLAGVGLDEIRNNLGLNNLAMGYPASFILGLANQGHDIPSSSTQPQFITIPLSVAMAGMAAGAPATNATNGCPSASSDDSSELQDLSTGRK